MALFRPKQQPQKTVQPAQAASAPAGLLKYASLPDIGEGVLAGLKISPKLAEKLAPMIGFEGSVFNNGGTVGKKLFSAQEAMSGLSPEYLQALDSLNFSTRTKDGEEFLDAFDASGNKLLTEQTLFKESAFENFVDKAIPAIVGLGGGLVTGGALGLFGQGAAGGAGGAGGGSAAGGIGAGEGAAQLAAYTAANPLTAAEVMATTLPAGGLPGLGSGLLGGLPAITVNPMDAINAYTAANPVTAQSLVSGVPSIAAPAASSGLSGLLQNGGQAASGAVGAVKDAVAPAAQWLKDNQTLGRLLLGGATSLLSSQGGGSGGASEAPSGPAVQWNSQLQKGLLAPVQQYAPDAIQQRPSGLLAQGNAGDGAWRFLRGQ